MDPQSKREFPQANGLMTAPGDMADCSDLGVLHCGYAGYRAIVSKWQPTEDEIARILVGEPVYLVILGTGMPPVALHAGEKSLELFTPLP